MKVREILTATNNLFEAMNTIKTLPWNEYIEPVEINAFYLNQYGNRLASEMLVNDSLENIAGQLIGIYWKKWNSIYQMLMQDFDFASLTNETITRNETTVNAGNETTIRILETSAYNEDDYGNKEKETTTTQGSETPNTKTSSMVRSKNNVASEINAFSKLLQRQLIYDIVFLDVNKSLTLSIVE